MNEIGNASMSKIKKKVSFADAAGFTLEFVKIIPPHRGEDFFNIFTTCGTPTTTTAKVCSVHDRDPERTWPRVLPSRTKQALFSSVFTVRMFVSKALYAMTLLLLEPFK